MSKILISILFLFLIQSFSVEAQTKIENLEIDIDSLIYLDYNNAYYNGFRVPNDINKKINFSFTVDTDTSAELYYIIYYQNESYKFPEFVKKENTSIIYYNNFSAENFYGSFTETFLGFKKIENSITKNSFVLQGNPRNEEKYFGESRTDNINKEEEINKLIKKIERNEDWLNNLKKKAIEDSISIKTQIKKDATWVVNENIRNKHLNNRWKRNLRLGKYSFLLVVTTKKDLDLIPHYIKDINIQFDEKYINPYFYFLYGEGQKLKNTNIIKIDNITRLKAKPPTNNGIYVNYSKDRHKDTSNFNKSVGNSELLYEKSAFAYYENERAVDEPVMNIPIITDFFGEGYDLKIYKKNSRKYKRKKEKIIFTNSTAPGSTFGVNKKDSTIYFFNPPSTPDNLRKENVGIKTRHGFTYGKYTVKIKMNELMTDDYVWTGLTNAIWMLSESLQSWNNRRTCWTRERGYQPYYGATKDVPTVPEMAYSEIDFEMVKAAEVWPKYSYPDWSTRRRPRTEPKENYDKIMIACTNWDLSCWTPPKFDVGVRQVGYGTDTFNVHRWHHWYGALTSKYPINDDIIFKPDYYYFQIEWKPTEIIWRVGPSKDSLYVVGYANDSITSIANNQMIMVITQEFHQSKWWPLAPFEQENIPFSGKKLEGRLYEIEIE